jgi:hypothetical protein
MGGAQKAQICEQGLVKETVLQRSIEFMQSTLCDLLIENETLRRRLAAGRIATK